MSNGYINGLCLFYHSVTFYNWDFYTTNALSFSALIFLMLIMVKLFNGYLKLYKTIVVIDIQPAESTVKHRTPLETVPFFFKLLGSSLFSLSSDCVSSVNVIFAYHFCQLLVFIPIFFPSTCWMFATLPFTYSLNTLKIL